MSTNTLNTLIVKITHGKDIRRFTTNVETFTWPALSERVANYFDLGDTPFKLTYVDDENDNITLASDEELAEAVTLANLSKPPILRLSVVEKKRKKEAAIGADAAAGTERATSPKPCASAELAPFLETLVKQMPAAIASLPDALRALGPQLEVDLDGTLAATQAARAAGCTDKTPQATIIDPFCSLHPHAPHATPGVHDGVTCDKSGVCPIVGNRYHLVGHNYDLCEQEFLKLPAVEQAKFRKVPPPATSKPPATPTAAPKSDQGKATPTGVHLGIECDKSGMCPIIGMRYHLRGQNYDLCQAEYDKLPADEQAKFEAISPPFQVPPCLAQAAKEMMHGGGMAAAMNGSGMAAAMGGGGGGWGGWGGGGSWRHGPHGGWRARGNNGGWGPGNGGCKMPEAAGCGPKPAARFVRDVTIFDGTQMSPGTPFTKIWRLKNVGDVPWPPGTKMLFVGGDAMTTQMEVPLSRDTPVMPGEEVDVAVEMLAPVEHGRYLGYWRLTGPHGRRKFGQRVWCHIQVVDPEQSLTHLDDLSATLAEIESKKRSLADTEKDEADDDAPDDFSTAVQALAAAAATSGAATSVAAASAAATSAAATSAAFSAATASAAVTSAATSAAAADVEVADMAEAKDGTLSDDGVLIEADMMMEEGSETKMEMAMAPSADIPTNLPTDPGPSGAPPMPPSTPVDTSTRAALLGMGFADLTLIEAVIAKNGEDLDACARDLASAAEWEGLLEDLEEMGFGNRELNVSLMLKNGGNIKRTVKDLVEA